MMRPNRIFLNESPTPEYIDVTNVLAIPKRFQNESHTKGSESGRKFGK